MGSGLFSPGHLLIVLGVVLLVFGPKRLPELGRSLGHGMRGFKEAISGEDSDEPAIQAPPAGEEPPAPPAAASATGSPPASTPPVSAPPS